MQLYELCKMSWLCSERTLPNTDCTLVQQQSAYLWYRYVARCSVEQQSTHADQTTDVKKG